MIEAQALAARALVLNEHQTALLLVTTDPARLWYTPGGHPQPGESLRECARREVAEETGLSVTPDRLVFVEEWFDAQLGEHKVDVYFLAQASQDTLRRDWHDTGGPDMRARIFTQQEINRLTGVFPVWLRDEFWQLLASGFAEYDPYRSLLSFSRSQDS